MVFFLPLPPNSLTLWSVAIVVRRPWESRAAPICGLEGEGARQRVGEGHLVERTGLPGAHDQLFTDTLELLFVWSL